MEIFLAQLFGVYFVIVGVVVAVRRKAFMPTVMELVNNRPLLLITAIVELAAGLAVTLAFPVISLSVPGILSLVGWMMIAEGVLYLALPIKTVQRFVKVFNTQTWYLYGGLISTLVGVYLAAKGFGYY